MNKKYRSAIIAAYIMIVMVGLIWHAGGASAEDTIKLTVNSRTTSTAALSNLKPGDETRSEYTIINEGTEDFTYFVDFKFRSGDAELYDILQMTLEKEGVIIYSGVMSEAEGRVAVGSLAGGAQSVIQMDVIFPWEAGNEYQAKSTTIAFEFSASGEPGPSTEPGATPTATATPDPSTGPGATPTATASPVTSASPTDSTAGLVTPPPGPSFSPAASPAPEEITVTEAPVPLGGSEEAIPVNSPSAAGGTASPTATPGTGDETILTDEDIPLAAPETGDELPDTAEPWYNLILISAAVLIISIILLRKLQSKK